MSLQPGDIVLIPDAPYTDYSQAKARPCLVVSRENFNSLRPDVILAPISSRLRYGDEMQVIVSDDDPSFTKTGLKVSSAIKCGSIFAHAKSRIQRKLGVLPSEAFRQVIQLIVGIFACD